MTDDQETIHRIGEIPEVEKAQAIGSADNKGDMHNDPDAPPISRGGLEAGVKSWRVARSLDTLLKHINEWAPRRSKSSDGAIGDAAHASRSSDHNPWIVDSGVGVVTARDFTHDPAHGCDCNELSDLLRASRDPRIKYMIWNRRICASEAKGGQPPWAWRPYTGANPHDHHIHVSVMPTKMHYDSTNAWLLPSKVPTAAAQALTQSGAVNNDGDPEGTRRR